MVAASWITLTLGAFGFVLNLIAVAVGYGVLKATVQALGARVDALESEMSAITELKVSVAELKTTMTFMLEQFKDLNSSIRWMREPAPSYEPKPSSDITPPRRRGS